MLRRTRLRAAAAALLLTLAALASGCARDDSGASGSLRQSEWRLVGEVALDSMAPGGVIEGVESQGGEMVAVVVVEGSPGGGRARQMSIILDASSHGRPLRSPLGTVWILPQTGQSRHRFVLPSGHWDLIIEKAGPYAAQIRVYERIGGDESSPSPSSPAASLPRTVAPDGSPDATRLQPSCNRT